MSKGRRELKVGLFVIVLLALAAIMSMKFSKTGFGLDDTYSINLRAENAGTVIKNSPVLMSGVKVGYVDEIILNKDESGKIYVELKVLLYEEFENVIRDGAFFRIKSSGFLGDQYIAVIPGKTMGKPLREILGENEWLECEAPFDIEDAGQKVSELIEKVDIAVGTIDGFVKKIDTGLLRDETVTNLTETIANFRVTSEKVSELIEKVDVAVGTIDGLFGKIDNGLLKDETVADFRETIANFKVTSEDVRKKFDDNGSISQGIKKFSTAMTEFNTFSTKLREDWHTAAPKVHQSVTDIAAFTDRLQDSANNVDKAVKRIDGFVEKIDMGLMSDENMTNITDTISNFRETSKTVKEMFTDNASSVSQGVENFNKGMTNFNIFSTELRDEWQAAVPKVRKSFAELGTFTSSLKDRADQLEQLISTNAPVVNKALKNIAAFSEKLDNTTAVLQSTLATNRTNITKVIGNISVATENLKGITENANKIMTELESGNGLAGGLLKNEEMRAQFQSLISNLNATAKGLTNIVKEINARGLFYKPKPEKIVIPRGTRPK